jgi:hypothetical protein
MRQPPGGAKRGEMDHSVSPLNAANCPSRPMGSPGMEVTTGLIDRRTGRPLVPGGRSLHLGR